MRLSICGARRSMSKTIDVMAWMQKAYIEAQKIPWYKKVVMRMRLFIDRHFKTVKGAPGAAMLSELEAADKARREARLADAGLAQRVKEESMTRARRARMWDSI